MSVKRLTVKPKHDPTGRQFSWALCHERLSAIEDILGDDYDLDQLSVLVNQRMTMREDVAARMKLVGGIPLDRLRELVEADREGRCVVLPCRRWDILWTYRNYPSLGVYSFTVTDISTLNGRTMLNTDILGVIDSRDVGKTVFRTREAAEAALKGWQDGRN